MSREALQDGWFICLLCKILILHSLNNIHEVQGTPGCAFHTTEGLLAENEGVRFIRLREDTAVGKQILMLRAYPRSTIRLKSSDNTGDHKYFILNELNSTTIVITLARSLEDLVDREVPKNLLKFRILCAAKNEKLEEASSLSITVYIEDVNDNAPEFLNSPYTVDVPENTAPGTIIFDSIQAIDRDKPNTPNSEVQFSIAPMPDQLSADGSPFFGLKSPHRPLLILKKELDFDNGIRSFKLPLFAFDRGSPSNQINTTVTINVKDIDDLPPKFTEGVYRTKINEFFPMTGSTIRVPLYFSPPIMAFDQDSLNASLIYDIISGNERKLFRVNSNNGVMYLTKEIDLEEESLPGNTFVLQIEARQKDNPLRKALARIEVEILDLNDNLPEFEADFYNISIVENLPTGFSVLQVNAVDRDQGENSEFLFNLIESKEAKGAFKIDSRSGWITVLDDHLLDREQRESLHLVVEAIERNPSYLEEKKLKSPGPSSVKVDISLLDTNDNTPKFEKGNLYEFKVPFVAPLNYVIGRVVAFDPDEGPNGQITYELQRPKGSSYIPFRLDSKNGTLYVNGPLRRGRIAIFVEASDQPTNPSERRFSLAVITIEVYSTIDAQSIDFIGAPYEFWVGSNAPVGTSVGQVRTSLVYENEDDVMYDLLHTYSEGVPFAIEERSGIITVIRELSEFTRTLYHFEGVANYLFANGSQSMKIPRNLDSLTTLSTTDLIDEGVLITNVTIHVVNKNENKVPLRPVIEEINMNVITFHVEENIPGSIIGQLLYKNGSHVLEKDFDSQRYLISYPNETMANPFRSRSRNHSRKERKDLQKRLPRRMISDSAIHLRYIIANQQEVVNKITITEDGTLLTIKGLDREEKDHYDLTIIVEYTAGMVSGAGIYQVNVVVDDINDNAPKFNALTFVGLINENSPPNTEVAVNQPIIITDADLGLNADFRVVLQGDYNDLFSIEYSNSSSTLLSGNMSRHALSRSEVFNIFNLTEQWNDEMRFVEMQTTFGKANLNFPSGPYFRIRYTGKRPLDREKDQLYNFKIVAIDTGGLSTFALLNVLIVDVNDNAPIFERISVFKDSKVEIQEYSTDMEIYFVESSSHSLNNHSEGMIMSSYNLPGSPRFNSESHFNSNLPQEEALMLRGRPRLKSRLRQARNTPNKGYNLKCPLFSIYENIPLATKVLQITATDEDFGKNAEVYYKITNEHLDKPVGSPLLSKMATATYFAIDKTSGELYVNYHLSGNTEVFLNLSATDIDGLQDRTCLRFRVIDVNDHAPVFKKTWYSFDTPEGDYKDSVLGQITAVDMDFGQNANITYSLNATNLPFAIKKYSGILKIVGSIDREVKEMYNFRVIASDNGEAFYRLSSSVDVSVHISDINDNKPEFIGYDEFGKADLYLNNTTDKTLLLPIYKAYLARNSNPGTFVKQLTAIDKDYVGNGNGLVLYSLSYQDAHSPAFRIDSRDGTITTITNFGSYNNYEHINFTVIASDLGSPSHSSTAIVLINLQGSLVESKEVESLSDMNVSHSNIFLHKFYEVSVNENNSPPTSLLQINLTDNLPVNSFRWNLEIEGDFEPEDEIDKYFAFDANTTILSALKSFDREVLQRFSIRLKAEKIRKREARQFPKVSYPISDERIQGLDNDECRIVINIIDENDNEPQFKTGGQPIIAVVPRTAKFGYPITQVEAIDNDEGLNAAVTYRILNEPANIFDIDENNGKIRLIGSINKEERVYGFDVKAVDRQGEDDGKSSIINVFVYIIDETRQVKIVLAGKPIEVEQRIDSLMQMLSQVLQMDVRVRLLEPHSGNNEPATDAYIYAVDFGSNVIMDMDQLHESLAGLQLDTLQFQHQQQSRVPDHNALGRTMPRIIELAEFSAYTPNNFQTPHLINKIETISIVFITLVSSGTVVAVLCFVCLRQKRLWSRQHFPTSETGLPFEIGVSDIHISNTSNDTGKRKYSEYRRSNRPNSSLVPESVCSSGKTQSTAVAQENRENPKQHLHRHHHSHKHKVHLSSQLHQPVSNIYTSPLPPLQKNERHREYIDVPLPKAIAKAISVRDSFSLKSEQIKSRPFILNFNSGQPVHNVPSHGTYDASLFSIHSHGQDSGVDFLSNRELFETLPDTPSSLTANLSASIRSQSQRKGTLCPKHTKAKLEAGAKTLLSLTQGTDSSDNYEDSLKNSDQLSSMITTNCRHNYQNTKFEKKNCIRHSFSCVKDDLMHSSPQVSLRPRSHILRNSMNDLEERLNNLEKSFQNPAEDDKSSCLF